MCLLLNNPHFNLSSKTPAVTVLRVSGYCSNSISLVNYKIPRNLFTRNVKGPPGPQKCLNLKGIYGSKSAYG